MLASGILLYLTTYLPLMLLAFFLGNISTTGTETGPFQSIETGILPNITGGSDLSLHEVNEAAEIVRAASDDRTNIIFGASVDEQLAGQMWVTVVATGFSMTGGPAVSSGQSGRPVVPPPDDLLEPPSFLQS